MAPRWSQQPHRHGSRGCRGLVDPQAVENDVTACALIHRRLGHSPVPFQGESESSTSPRCGLCAPPPLPAAAPRHVAFGHPPPWAGALRGHACPDTGPRQQPTRYGRRAHCGSAERTGSGDEKYRSPPDPVIQTCGMMRKPR